MDGLLLINKVFKIISTKILEWIKYSGIKIQRKTHYTYESLEEHQKEIPLKIYRKK